MTEQELIFKFGKFNMCAEYLRNILREMPDTKKETFSDVFALVDMLCDSSDIFNEEK